MPQIVADLRLPSGAPLFPGAIIVTPQYWINSPGYTVAPQPYPVVLSSSGPTVFNLEASAVARVSYKFEVFDTSANPAKLWAPAFFATVPDQPTVLWADLIPTGIAQDAQDSSKLAIAQRLRGDIAFIQELAATAFDSQGAYFAGAYYSPGSVVLYDGSSWWYPPNGGQTIIGQIPYDGSPYWVTLGARGATGTGVLGNPAAYDATAWLNQTDAPSRGAVRNALEARATLIQVQETANNPLLTTPRRNGPALGQGEASNQIPDTAWVQTLVAAVRAAVNPVGTINAIATTAAPTGWLFCDGRTISRTVYAALFTAIGTTYNTGGEAVTDFRLPDLRARVLACRDFSPTLGASSRLPAWSQVPGGSAGADTHTLGVTEMPSHSHAPSIGQIATVVASGGGGSFPGGITLGTTGLSNTGGGLAHNNVQPTIAIPYYIFANA